MAKAFHITLTEARRKWLDDFLHLTNIGNLWTATRWQRGRRVSKIPPLTVDGVTAQRPEDIAPLFRDRFFPTQPAHVEKAQPDDPPPEPRHTHHPVSTEEVADALRPTSNSSAPGPSGIGYKLIKWAFSATPDRFVSLFNGCLLYGKHPWTEAKVVPIPKPGKPDYTVPKAYRPISLLECCGKLLEKVVAKRIMSDLNAHNLLPGTQFGSRDYHCATDAALVLTHTAQQGLAAGYPVATLLFDIQGFFDNINRDRVVHIFDILGFPLELVRWIESFLSDQTLALHFNGWASTLFEALNGTPQGSPLSPILSAVYTIPLLRLAERWVWRMLSLYFDDGNITASGPTHRESVNRVITGFQIVSDWLKRCGLRTDPDKTEFISFFNPRWLHALKGSPPHNIVLQDASNGTISIPHSASVRYLGIFIHYTLSWDLHVRTMVNRARSTIRALHMLGNSIRGLDLANWRKVFHAIVLPVLSYGAPLWARLPHTTMLIKKAQVAQNDVLCRMAGVFKTMPVEPLHSLTAVLPFSYTLTKLASSYSDCIARLPPSHLLRSIDQHNPAAYWPCATRPPSSLTRLLPLSFQPFHFPARPGSATWSHPRVQSYCHTAPSSEVRTFTREVICLQSHLHLYVRLVPFDNAFVAASLLYFDGHISEFKLHRGHLGPEAMLAALVHGTGLAASYGGDHHLSIFLPNRLLSPYLFSLKKHRYLHLTYDLTTNLTDFLSGSNSSGTVRFFWYSTEWTGLPGLGLFQDTAAADPPPLSSLSQPTLTSRRDEAYLSWYQDFTTIPCRRSHALISTPPPDGNKFPPFTVGLLSAKNRRLMCTGFQLTTRHCFDANYSFNFRPNAGDETTCPCSYSSQDPQRVELLARRVEVARRRIPSFDELQRHYENPSLSPPPSSTRHTSPRTLNDSIVPHTVEHVLSDCPLTLHLRDTHLHHSGLHFIFGTEAGGIALTRFLHFLQLLQRPLPPRPDPP